MAVTVTLKEPSEDVMFSVEVAELAVGDKTMLVDESVGTPRPWGSVAVRLIVPEKP